MVMLDAKPLNIRMAGKLGGEITRIQIVSDDLRLDAKDVSEMMDTLLERSVRLGIAHIPDVMAEKRVAVPRQAEGILEIRPHGKGRFDLKGQPDRIWSIAAPSAQEKRAASIHFDDRIIGTNIDLAIVQQECICQR